MAMEGLKWQASRGGIGENLRDYLDIPTAKFDKVLF